MPAPRPLVDFYLGTAPDDHGRTFDAILAHDDEWLEYTHNFIQWLFPLTSNSGANPTAPTLEPHRSSNSATTRRYENNCCARSTACWIFTAWSEPRAASARHPTGRKANPSGSPTPAPS